jgi:hypothetical protein
MQKAWFYFFTTIAIFFSLFSISFADDLSISQVPDSPREGEEVRFTLTSDKYDLNQAKVTWSVDGDEVDSGVGRKTLNYKTPTNGLGVVVVAKVEQDGFDPNQVQRVLEANTNFILYEGADSYVPSFYKGRRLPAKEGTVRASVFSFKDGNIVGLNGSGNENYTWRVNGEDKQDLSGLNKIINNIQSKVTDNSLNIRVVKEDVDKNRKISEVNIPLQPTEVVVYKTDEKKLLKQVLSDTEVGKKIFLLVEPFFFSAPDKKSSALTYTWKINDQETAISTPWSVVFSGKDQDSVEIKLGIINNRKVTQESYRGFTFKVQ